MVDASADLETVAGWVWSSNVRPLVEMISVVVGYDFDESDWQAISFALPDTDDDRLDAWYSYPLVGRSRVEVGFARSVEGDEVSVKVSSVRDHVLRARLEVLLDVFCHYTVVQ
jgi:hypothetical protein